MEVQHSNLKRPEASRELQQISTSHQDAASSMIEEMSAHKFSSQMGDDYIRGSKAFASLLGRSLIRRPDNLTCYQVH